MRPISPPPSCQISALSPTAFEVMRSCRLRTAFRAQPGGDQATRTAPQALGDLCHAVLERLVETRSILDSDWADQADVAWHELGQDLAVQVQEGRHETTLSGPVETWPGQRMKRARLRKAAGRLHELLAPVAAQAELVTEEPLRASAWPLRGRPDLIVRLPQDTWIVDYKSGGVLDTEGIPRDSYVRQLELYALLEADASGRWPSCGILVPLNGQRVVVAIEERVARDLAEEAARLLADYNARAPAPQPGSPSPQICRFCPYSPSCPSFWAAYDESWVEELRALRGLVRRCDRATSGSVTLLLEVEETGELTWVQDLSTGEHPAAATLQPGQALALTGLREEEPGRAWSLPPWGRLAVVERAAT